MRVLICGGRVFRGKEVVFVALDALDPAPSVIIAGGASGADYLAMRWAQERGVEFLEFPADWNRHGKAAGPIRNQRMLDEGRPDLVIAFPGGRGSADMARRAEAAGVKVQRVSP